MQIIIISVILVSLLAFIIGIFLCISSEVFKVKIDEKVLKIRDCLPGNNCGGCGYAGCDALADAISKGMATINQCPVGGTQVAAKIGKIMGKSASEEVKKVAFIHCNGTCVNAKKLYEYNGVKDCRIVATMPNCGEKQCSNACIGYGNCINSCKFNAINIIDGVAKVDEDKCVACGQCINACPMKIIELVPYKKKHLVQCSNKDKGKTAIEACNVSCIGCGICQKTCTKDSIKVIDNLAIMTYDSCNDCGDCSKKCPRKCIS